MEDFLRVAWIPSAVGNGWYGWVGLDMGWIGDMDGEWGINMGKESGYGWDGRYVIFFEMGCQVERR